MDAIREFWIKVVGMNDSDGSSLHGPVGGGPAAAGPVGSISSGATVSAGPVSKSRSQLLAEAKALKMKVDKPQSYPGRQADEARLKEISEELGMDLGGGTTGGAADSPPGSGEPTHPPAGTGSGPPAPPAENTITVQTPNGPEQMTEAEYRRRIEQAKEYVRQRVKEAATRGVTKAQLEQEAARQFGLDNNWSRMQGRGRRVIQTVTGELRELTPEEYHELTNRARDYVETRLNNPNNKISREQLEQEAAGAYNLDRNWSGNTRTANSNQPPEGGGGPGSKGGGNKGESEANPAVKQAHDKIQNYQDRAQQIEQKQADLEKRQDALETKLEQQAQGKGNNEKLDKEQESLSKEQAGLDKETKAMLSEGEGLANELYDVAPDAFEGMNPKAFLEGSGPKSVPTAGGLAAKAANGLATAFFAVQSISYIMESNDKLSAIAQVGANYAVGAEEAAIFKLITDSTPVTLILGMVVGMCGDQGGACEEQERREQEKAQKNAQTRALYMTVGQYLEKKFPGSVEFVEDTYYIHDQALWDKTVKKIVQEKKLKEIQQERERQREMSKVRPKTPEEMQQEANHPQPHMDPA